MAYTLAKIDIREQKGPQTNGTLVEYDLIEGLIPVACENYYYLPTNNSRTDFNKIADNTEPGGGEFSYFPALKKVKINYNADFDDSFLVYALLVSNKPLAHYALDPTDTVSKKYIWQPYIGKTPRVIESAQNILEGLITYNSLSIELQTSTDKPLHKFLGSSFSVLNQKFKMWRVENDTITAIYTGIGEAPTFRKNSVLYNCVPYIKKLNQPAYFGLTVNDDSKNTPLTVGASMPCSFFSSQGIGDSTNREKKSQLGYSVDSGIIECPYTVSGTTLTVYSTLTMGAYNYTDYRNYSGGSIFIEKYGGLNSYLQFDYVASNKARDEKNTGLQQKKLAALTDYVNPISLTSPNWIHDGPVCSDVTTDQGVYQFVPWELYVQDGANVRVFYYGATLQDAPTNSSNYPEPNTGNISMRRTFNLAISFKSGTLPEYIEELSSYAQIIPHNLYSITSVQGEGGFYRYQISISTTALKDFYKFTEGTAFTSKKARIFLVYEKDYASPANIEASNFIDGLLEASGITADTSEVDFNDSIQFYTQSTLTYGEILQKAFSSYGLFLRYNHDTETGEVKKIDSVTASTLTLYDYDYKNLVIKTKGRDTYKKVLFKNPYAPEGSRPGVALSSYTINTEKENREPLNETEGIKEIELVSYKNPRLDDVAQFHFDNKYVYSFETPAESKYLDINLSDWITIESDQIPETSGAAKILITRKEIGETSLRFEGIKFASIN